MEEAIGTDRGDAIVTAMIIALRARGILLPGTFGAGTPCPGCSCAGTRQAYKALTANLGHEQRSGLTALIEVNQNGHTPLAWLREWPEAPTQKNLVGIVERLQAIYWLRVFRPFEICP